MYLIHSVLGEQSAPGFHVSHTMPRNENPHIMRHEGGQSTRGLCTTVKLDWVILFSWLSLYTTYTVAGWA